MDMSISSLNTSYPAVTTADKTAKGSAPTATQEAAQDKTASKPQEPKRGELEKAVKDIQDFVQSSQRNLNFSIDDSTGTVVVKVIATDSGEVVRQIPNETVLKLAQDLTSASHLLLNARA